MKNFIPWAVFSVFGGVVKNLGRSSPATISFWWRRSGDDFWTGTNEPVIVKTWGGGAISTGIGNVSSEHCESQSRKREILSLKKCFPSSNGMARVQLSKKYAKIIIIVVVDAVVSSIKCSLICVISAQLCFFTIQRGYQLRPSLIFNILKLNNDSWKYFLKSKNFPFSTWILAPNIIWFASFKNFHFVWFKYFFYENKVIIILEMIWKDVKWSQKHRGNNKSSSWKNNHKNLG